MYLKLEDELNKLPRILIIIMICLIAAHLCMVTLKFGFGHPSVYGLSSLFNLDGEFNFPAWFSAIMLFIASVLLYVIYKISLDIKPDYFWLFLSIIFLYLSFDEMAGFHERFVYTLRNNFNLSGFFYFSWVIVGIPFALLVGLLSVPFLRRLPPLAAKHFITAGFVYVLGAAGMEMIGASVFVTHQNKLLYVCITTIEETLEMCGVILFIYSLVRHLTYLLNRRETY